VADRGEHLPARHYLVGEYGLAGRRGRHEPIGVLQLHALRPLQVQEVPERPLAERQQVELHPSGKVSGTSTWPAPPR
jgi:hypothetical protein